MSRKSPFTVVPLALARARNGFGAPLSADARERILALVNNPCERTWDEAFSLIINPKPLSGTLWNAVTAVDPTFPRSAPLRDRGGRKLRSWLRVPTADLVVRAIEHATSTSTRNSEQAR